MPTVESKALRDRFLSRIDKESGAPCWLWTGAKCVRGYGRLNVTREKVIKAHRYSWEYFNGRSIPDGLVICHSCDNTSCVNPDHLRADTQAFNNREAIERRRWHPNLGLQNGRAVLTEQSVAEIRQSKDTQMVLAARYGVGQTQISRIKRKESWASL
jgi:hypothetical protein